MAGLLDRRVEDVGIVHGPQERVVAAAEHVIDLGMQLVRNPFAVSREQMLSLCLGNAVAVQDTVWITRELSA